MTVKRAAGGGGAACLLIVAVLAGVMRAQEQPALLAKLKAGGVPARAAAMKGGLLAVSVELSGAAARDPEAIRKHAMVVFRAAAGMLPPGATGVAVEWGGPGEVYASWTASAGDAADFAAGRIDEARLLARLERKSLVSLKELMSSALPDEAAINEDLRKLEAEGRSGAGQKTAPAPTTTTQAGAKPAPAARAKPPVTPPDPAAAPETPKALFERGEQLLKERDYWGATEYFRRTLDAFPMEANQGLGLCYYGAGLVDAALRHFAEAYRLDPRSRLTVLYLATCNDKLGRREEAVRRYEEYLTLQPDDPKVAEFVRGRLAALR